METEKKIMEENGDEMVKPNYKLISLQKILVMILISIAAAFVVYYSPMPEEYFEHCDRQCNELDWPMICRVKLIVEVYKTLSKSCGNCVEQPGEECPPMCISADGRERGVLSVNRALPAPALHVCENDILVVDVVHRAPAHALAMHWRGQPQKETPFMDGAPMLTQCPQPAYTTFQYKFRASAPGTHMYHAHSTADSADGLAGALVVRQAKRVDPVGKLYDYDITEHTVFIAEWGHSMGPLSGMISKIPNAESLLINGKGKTAVSSHAPLSKFTIEYGGRYRFRVVYGSGYKSCPVKFLIEEHNLDLIMLDGNIIEPETVSSIELGKGERADFVLKASKSPGVYKMRVIADRSCQENLEGVAEVVYKNKESTVLVENDADDGFGRKFTTVRSDRCNLDDVLCLDEVHSWQKLPEDLAGHVDETLYVPLNYSSKHLTKRKFESWGQTDGHRFTYPESPLLTQGENVDPDALCPLEQGQGDECVHVKNVPLHSTVEVILFDQGDESDHIFHLHGYSFYVVGVSEYHRSLSKEEIKKMNEEGTLFPSKNLIDPVIKDTIVVPKLGVVALRFKADNPGYWMMRDERSTHWTRGFDFVFKVGVESDFVRAPSGFPKCGSYVGPEYFL